MAFFPVLSTEVLTDPNAVGYAGMTDQQVADSLNDSTGVDVWATLEAAELWGVIDQAQWDGLGNPAKNRINEILALSGPIEVRPQTRARAAFQTVFGQGTQTMRNLIAQAKITGSRASELGLRRVTAKDVARVRS